MARTLQEQTKVFVGYLQKLVDEERTDALLALRHGIRSKGEPLDMAPIINPWVEKASPWTRRCYYLTSSLFALHPSGIETGNMGDHYLVVQGISYRAKERRLSRLLRFDRRLAADEIVRWVQLLKKEEIPANYAHLLRDLISWGHPSGFVQRSWAAAFYREERPEETQITVEGA